MKQIKIYLRGVPFSPLSDITPETEFLESIQSDIALLFTCNKDWEHVYNYCDENRFTIREIINA